MRYSWDDVKNAVESLRSKLGIAQDPRLQHEFEVGLHPSLLSYGKIQETALQLPIIQKYLIGASTFFRQPCNYYDIFRVCRCVNLIQVLDRAVTLLLTKNISGLDQRLDRLLQEREHDRADAIVFELITSARYLLHDHVKHIELIAETAKKKTPDFLVQTNGKDSYVECKKIDRTQNHTVLIRNVVREHLDAVIEHFKVDEISISGEITFNADPQTIDRKAMIEAFNSAIRFGTPIICSQFTISAKRLPKFKSADLTLFPSPKFWWERYGYRVRSEWFGIVQGFLGSFGSPVNMPSDLRQGASTWVDEVDWDAGIKWRIGSETMLGKYKRFTFEGVFKGLEQVKGLGGEDSAVHLWLETDYYVGSRSEPLRDLFKRIATRGTDSFGWLIINETLFDVSPKGFFDLIEHAHMIRGPQAIRPNPLVSGVFVPEGAINETGDFGIGTTLPDIDET